VDVADDAAPVADGQAATLRPKVRMVIRAVEQVLDDIVLGHNPEKSSHVSSSFFLSAE
jgi:hypothetical protein